MRVSFTEFVDRKAREAKKQLRIIKEVMLKSGLKALDFIESSDDGDPYIFVYNTQTDASFSGIRVYKIGEAIAFRIQKQPKTHPYGTAYEIKLVEMFNDIIGEDTDSEEEAGKMVIEGVVKEIKKFFELSRKIEKELQTNDITGAGDLMGRIVVQAQVGDYSNAVSSYA